MMSCEYLRVIYCLLKYLFHVFMFLSIAFFKALVVLDFFFFTWVLLKLCLISELAQIYLTILIDFFSFIFSNLMMNSCANSHNNRLNSIYPDS